MANFSRFTEMPESGVLLSCVQCKIRIHLLCAPVFLL